MSLRWLPNAISLLRIALVAPIVLLIIEGRYGLALGLSMVAGFSDGVDGYLANRFDWHTRIGALLDPIADKLLVSSTSVGKAQERTRQQAQNRFRRQGTVVRAPHCQRKASR